MLHMLKKENSNRKKSRCQVRDCARNPLASMHRLPTKNERLRKKWIDKLKLSNINDPFHVCGDHFVSTDFSEGYYLQSNQVTIGNHRNTRKRLRQIAVPSVNLPSNSMVLENSVNDKVTLNVTVDVEQLWDSSFEDECDQDSAELIVGL